MMHEDNHPICNYEGSAYRTEFWGSGRDYEDRAERAALERLLPPTGRRLIDIGGGYGRLAPLYRGYAEVVIFDYARSQLRQGQELWGQSGPAGYPRFRYVAGDFYDLPFAPGLFNTVTMIRTLHHAADAPGVLRGVSEILAPGGTLVLEFASKRNLKAILRYLVGAQEWSPFEPEPVEFVELNFDFHPAWVREQLAAVGLDVQERLAVSTFRLPLLKRLVPTDLLVRLDALCQPTGGLFPLSPSVFVRSQADPDKPPAPADVFFCCPSCGSTAVVERNTSLACDSCDARFTVRDGIYDLRAAVGEASHD